MPAEYERDNFSIDLPRDRYFLPYFDSSEQISIFPPEVLDHIEEIVRAAFKPTDEGEEQGDDPA
jgi:hypothetical protein